MADYLPNKIVDDSYFGWGWIRITVQRKGCMLKDILTDIIRVERP